MFFPKRMYQRDLEGLQRYADFKCLQEHGVRLEEKFIKNSTPWRSYMDRCAVELCMQDHWPSQVKRQSKS